jgi:hypothetical protein
VPAIVAIGMVIARALDILAAKKFKKDDGIFANLICKQKMPLRDDLFVVALDYTSSDIYKDTENDVFCLARAINGLFQRTGGPEVFHFDRTFTGN